jgi:hypothetical protein
MENIVESCLWMVAKYILMAEKKILFKVDSLLELAMGGGRIDRSN